MDRYEIQFCPELEDQFLPCLNNCLIRIDRIAGYCRRHGVYVSKKQILKRKCDKKECFHFDTEGIKQLLKERNIG